VITNTWAATIGPRTAELVAALMEQRPHPEHGYRACLGIIRLNTRYPEPRLERACARALVHRAISYRSVEAILKHKLDEQETTAASAHEPLPLHANIRGPRYYH
jgi:transposase